MYTDNSLVVVRTEMFLQMKAAANRSFLTDKLAKFTVQPAIGSASMNPPSTQRVEPALLFHVELHPILCHNASTATCTSQVSPLSPTPSRLLVVDSRGQLPSHLEDCEALSPPPPLHPPGECLINAVASAIPWIINKKLQSKFTPFPGKGDVCIVAVGWLE